jgi:hypothetical protein
MKKLQALLLLLIFTLTVSAQKIIKAEQVTDHSIHVIGNNFEGVIFLKSYSTNSLADSSKRFTPTVEQIAQTENILQHQLGKLYHKYPKSGEFYVSNHIEDYYRQYTGFINKKGDSIIVINAFTKDLVIDNLGNKKTKIPNWFTRLVEAFDGGSSIWHGNVDLNKKILIGIVVNGVG